MIDKHMQDHEWRRLYVAEGAANEVAETIARIMQDGGLSVADVAQRADMSERGVKSVLRGTGMTVQRIAEILDVLGYRISIKIEKT